MSRRNFNDIFNPYDIYFNFDVNLKCKVCCKMFYNERFLNAHMLTHGVPGMKCEECSKIFSTHKELYKHMKAHDSIYNDIFDDTPIKKCNRIILDI